ncbi:MAG: phosphoribosylamine--glycine ligase [Candidatus Bathyarchaeia archaeon]
MVEVLVVDAGGRGNALAYSFARSPLVDRVFVAPGNAGSSLLSKCRQVPIAAIDAILGYAREKAVSLTFVGPEGYLSDGIVDRFHAAGLTRIVGPTQAATVLESSKCDTKDFLHRIGVPIPFYRNFADPAEAKSFVEEFYRENPGENLVVKADGLAAGKGSIVCSSKEEALYAVDYLMVRRAFGEAGRRVDIERRLHGWELMFFVLTDGRTALPLEAAMDYKRAFDGECDARTAYERMKRFGVPNPNTGGMGGYSPHPWLDGELRERIMQTIVLPTITRFRELRGIEYKGILYFGLMVCEENGGRKPYVLEINVRMGDPEAEIILPRLKTDFYLISEAILDGRLHEIELEWDPSYYVGVCAVSGRIVRPAQRDPSLDWYYLSVRDERYEEERNVGYPGPHITSQPITGLEYVMPDAIVFHNGTAFDTRRSDLGSNDRLGSPTVMTTGGRVLTVVARGETLEEARLKAYESMRRIHFSNKRHRWEIGLPCRGPAPSRLESPLEQGDQPSA